MPGLRGARCALGGAPSYHAAPRLSDGWLVSLPYVAFLSLPAAAATSYRPDGEVDLLTKGDNNPVDDRGLYPPGQLWLNERHIIGRAKGYPPTTQLVLLVCSFVCLFVWLLAGFCSAHPPSGAGLGWGGAGRYAHHHHHHHSPACSFLPYVGMVTIVMNDYPYLKFLLIGVLGLFVLSNRE